jgi:hypothetical protein
MGGRRGPGISICPTTDILHATSVATDNIMKLKDNKVAVARLQDNQGDIIEGKNLSLFSGEEFDL